jgi:Pretoxin HINT domain
VEQTVRNQIRLIEDLNARINDSNERVLPLLEALTGQSLGANQEPWRNWWIDQLDLTLVPGSSEGKPPAAETVETRKSKEAEPNVKVQRLPLHACCVAGTLVHAIDGPRPVESIQVGDLVFSQNTTSGEISLQPVLAVHQIKPTPTVKVETDRDNQAIVVTRIHRFWTIGTGWTMAADLKAGDKLRVVGGVVTVQHVESDATEPVYNLDVAQNRNLFVGKSGLLVHDFSFVPAVFAPFDRVSDPAASAANAAPHPR